MIYRLMNVAKKFCFERKNFQRFFKSWLFSLGLFLFLVQPLVAEGKVDPRAFANEGCINIYWPRIWVYEPDFPCSSPFENDIDTQEALLYSERLLAVKEGRLSRELLSAWEELSQTLFQLWPQVSNVNRNSDTVKSLHKKAIEQSERYERLFYKENTIEPHRIPAVFRKPLRRLQSDVVPLAELLRFTDSNLSWSSIFDAYQEATARLDLMLYRKMNIMGDNRWKQVFGLVYRKILIQQMIPLNAKPVQAEFYPSEVKKGSNEAEYIKLFMYYWNDGKEWHLKDVTNPIGIFEDTYPVKNRFEDSNLQGPPKELMDKLDYRPHFPAGEVRYKVGDQTLKVPIKSGLRWYNYLEYASFGIVITSGAVIAICAPGSMLRTAGFWALSGSGVFTVAAAIGDLSDRSLHGCLGSRAVLMDLLQITTAIASAGVLVSGRILVAAQQASAVNGWTNFAAQTAVLSGRLYMPFVTTTLMGNVVSFAITTQQQYEDLKLIDSSPGDPADKKRAKLLLLTQWIVSAGLTVLSVQGSIASFKPFKTLVLHPGIDGIPTATLAMGQESAVIDTMLVSAIEKDAAGKSLVPTEKLAIDRLKELKLIGADLRVTETVLAERLNGKFNPTPLQKAAPTMVLKGSPEWNKVIKKLEEWGVGGSRGIRDRTIVAEALFSATEPGVVPRFATQDSGILSNLLKATDIKIGSIRNFDIAKSYKNGFEALIEGRKLWVIPIPKKP